MAHMVVNQDLLLLEKKNEISLLSLMPCPSIWWSVFLSVRSPVYLPVSFVNAMNDTELHPEGLYTSAYVEFLP